MYTFKLIIAKIKTWIYLIKYRKASKLNRAAFKKVSLLKPDPNDWNKPHPLFDKCLVEYSRKITNYKGKIETCAFGDSLLDLPRDDYDEIPSISNFSIKGSWAHHMTQMVKAIHPFLKTQFQNIKYVVIGSLGGNPLLRNQPWEITTDKSIETLDTIRRLFPIQRIIVYGLPPTISTYANLTSLAFEQHLFYWVHDDENSIFLPLQKRFAGKFHIFPKIMSSSDGIHFSPVGVVHFDNLIKKAKQSLPRKIVD